MPSTALCLDLVKQVKLCLQEYDEQNGKSPIATITLWKEEERARESYMDSTEDRDTEPPEHLPSLEGLVKATLALEAACTLEVMINGGRIRRVANIPRTSEIEEKYNAGKS